MPVPSRAALEALAVRAGTVALASFRNVAAERKPDRTLVTRADREVERLLVGELETMFPAMGIVSEEGAARPAGGPYRAVLDPIDGTSAFVAGLPTWCICIGILREAEPVAGVVHLPTFADTYSADVDGAWWNGRRLPPLADTNTPGDPFVVVDAKMHRRHRLQYAGKVRSLGSTAYHLALVARGVADAAVVGQAHLWDLAAPTALLAAVGGRLEYLSGAVVDLAALLDGQRTREQVIAGTPDRLAALRAVLVPGA